MLLYRFIVRGDVQGVGYRSFTVRSARQLSIKGYVRNLPNGEVEVFGQGTTKDLEEFENALLKGPLWARVTEVVKEVIETEKQYTDFSIRF